MRLTIRDELRGEQAVVEKATIIPRVGEKVKWTYYPTPTVKDVMYDFGSREVLVTIS